jgi:hypothetical protein
MIKILHEEIVQSVEEKHFKLDVNGKEIWVSKWHEFSNMPGTTSDGGTDIIKGNELLSEDEEENVMDFIGGL